MSRVTARAAAMQMIYEKSAGGQGGEDTLRMVYDELRLSGVKGVEKVGINEPNAADREYILQALEGVLNHLDEIDPIIEKAANDWTIERMPLVDLTCLRLAVWEILYRDDIPDSVSVSEALEMTERYSDPDDKRFINGVLGTIIREKKSIK